MDKQQLQARIESVEKRLRTNLELVEKKLIDLQNDTANFKAKLDEMHDEPEIPDFPTYSAEPLYFMDNRFRIVGDESNICNGGANDYNMFHTKEMAKEFADKCKLIAMMLHCKWYIDRDFIQDWSDPLERKWQLYYDHDEKKMVVGAYSHSDFGVVFSTEENAQKCAEWLNAHWKENTDE